MQEDEFPRRCSCGHSITWSIWRAQALVGTQYSGSGDDRKHEIRNCPACKSSLAMPAEACR